MPSPEEIERKADNLDRMRGQGKTPAAIEGSVGYCDPFPDKQKEEEENIKDPVFNRVLNMLDQQLEEHKEWDEELKQYIIDACLGRKENDPGIQEKIDKGFKKFGSLEQYIPAIV